MKRRTVSPLLRVISRSQCYRPTSMRFSTHSVAFFSSTAKAKTRKRNVTRNRSFDAIWCKDMPYTLLDV